MAFKNSHRHIHGFFYYWIQRCFLHKSNGFRFPEESGRAISGLALASIVDRRACFLPPVTTLFCAILSLFGRVDFGHADLGTLQLGLLILGVCSE
jgi:hypothetical protein